MGLHGESPPSAEATLRPGFRAPGKGPGGGIFGGGMVFDSALTVCAAAAAGGPLDRLLPRAATARPSHATEAVKRKSVRSGLFGRLRRNRFSRRVSDSRRDNEQIERIRRQELGAGLGDEHIVDDARPEVL